MKTWTDGWLDKTNEKGVVQKKNLNRIVQDIAIYEIPETIALYYLVQAHHGEVYGGRSYLKTDSLQEAIMFCKEYESIDGDDTYIVGVTSYTHLAVHNSKNS